MNAILDQKGNHDFGTGESVSAHRREALRSGKYLAQVEHLKQGYSKKLYTMLDALERYMPKHDGLHWTRPAGGLYVWLTLPESIDTSRGGMFEKAVEAGVLYVPGVYCFQPDERGHVPTNHLRLCFGNVAAERVEPGIEKLAGVVRTLLRATGEPPASTKSKHGQVARAT
jgi:2-aminoadipate transaminase